MRKANSKMEWRSRGVTSVSSALGFVLRMSRPIGIAPLRFVRQSNGWLVSVSPALCAYSYLFITLLNVTSIITLLLDLSAAPETSVHVNMPTRRAVWVTDLTVVTIASSVAGYSAPSQMRNMIVYLNQLHKINFELRNYRTSEPLEKYKIGMVVLCFVGTLLLLVIDFLVLTAAAVRSQGNVTVACMYCTYYCSYVVLELKEIQFVMIALDIHFSLVSINNGLRSLLRDIDFEYIPNFKQNNSKAYHKIGMPGKIIPAKSINAVTDYMTAKTVTGTSVRTSRSSSETIRRLALSYSFICDLVKQVDQCYGLILLLLICSFLLHLVVTPYNLITSLLEGATLSTRLSSLALQVFWVSFHLVNLVMVIEPAHRTHEEMEITKELVIHLIRTTTTYDHLAAELEFFYKQLVLNNNVSYSPLKVFTLNRSLIATILGSITTYLVIVIQAGSNQEKYGEDCEREKHRQEEHQETLNRETSEHCNKNREKVETQHETNQDHINEYNNHYNNFQNKGYDTRDELMEESEKKGERYEEKGTEQKNEREDIAENYDVNGKGPSINYEES